MDNDMRIKIIERFDSYYAGINNKGSFLLAFNTFFIGLVVVNYKNLLSSVIDNLKCYLCGIIVIIVFSFISSIFFTIKAIVPYFGSENINRKKSCWFFYDIATDDKETFFNRINNYTADDIASDLNNQIFELSVGLKKKHEDVKIALIFDCIIICMFVILFFFIKG